MPSRTPLSWLVALTLPPIAAAQETSLNVVELHNRPAEQIIADIQPLLSPDEIVRADGFKLLLKCRPEHYSQIEQLIQQLDTPQVDLIVSVIQNSGLSAEQLNAQSGIGPEQGMRGMNASTLQIGNNQQMQQIRTLDGQPAIIESGQQRPVQSISAYGYNSANSNGPNSGASHNGYGNYNGFSTQTQWQNATTGFAVTPHLQDAQNVLIDIGPWSQQLQNNYNRQQQSLHTTLRARLGAWIDIGGQGVQAASQQQGMNGLNYNSFIQQQHTVLKIDKAER
jgi:type II secretory pathway component GspD/PulD (secretin)